AGAETLTLRLAAPNPRLLYLLSTVPPTGSRTPLHPLAGKAFPGTAPYIVRSFVPNRELTLVRNPRFHVWSPAARPDGYPDEIDVRMTRGPKGATAVVDEVAGGRADVALAANFPSLLPSLKTRYASQLHFASQ